MGSINAESQYKDFFHLKETGAATGLVFILYNAASTIGCAFGLVSVLVNVTRVLSDSSTVAQSRITLEDVVVCSLGVHLPSQVLYWDRLVRLCLSLRHPASSSDSESFSRQYVTQGFSQNSPCHSKLYLWPLGSKHSTNSL
jgi:hypothetical protein